jgi:hypothetical protein
MVWLVLVLKKINKSPTMKKLIILISLIFSTANANELISAIAATDLPQVTRLLESNTKHKRAFKSLCISRADQVASAKNYELASGKWWAELGFNATSELVPGEGRYLAGALINTFLLGFFHSMAEDLPQYKYWVFVPLCLTALSSLLICRQKIYDLKLEYVKKQYQDSLKIKELVRKQFSNQLPDTPKNPEFAKN